MVWNRVKIREKVQRYEGGTGRVRNVCRDLQRRCGKDWRECMTVRRRVEEGVQKRHNEA